MQVILEDKDERDNSERTSAVDPLVCTERVSRYIEGKCNGGVRSRGGRI